MAVTFAQLFHGVMGQESGGNHLAVNSLTGALGLFQVLPSNVGPWGRKYLGRSITPSQFLHNRDLQMELVTAVMQDYYNRYGARGAASAWYSGNPNLHNSTRPQPGGPSIKDYVDQVMSKAAAHGGDNPYGYNVGSTTDSRVKNTALSDVLGQNGMPEKLDALSGVDRNALGLDDLAAPGLAAAEGGAGLSAAQGPAPSQPQSNPGQSVGDTFASKWQQAETIQQQSPAGEGLRGAFIDMASQYVGTPYVWGGSAPGGFDCSGLIQYALKQVGIQFPRVTWDQIAAGTRTDLSKLKPGDLVGFGSGGHIAIWLGNNQILEAPRTGLNVRVRALGQNENTYGVALDSIFK